MTMCSDVMTEDLVYCMPGDSAMQAAQLMKKEDVGPVLIVEEGHGKVLVGIVTDRDLALKVVGEGRDPQTTPVKDVMSKKLITCRAEDDVEKAMSAMAQYQLRRIPVVADGMKLVGIISQADIARENAPEKTGEVVKEISQQSV